MGTEIIKAEQAEEEVQAVTGAVLSPQEFEMEQLRKRARRLIEENTVGFTPTGRGYGYGYSAARAGEVFRWKGARKAAESEIRYKTETTFSEKPYVKARPFPPDFAAKIQECIAAATRFRDTIFARVIREDGIRRGDVVYAKDIEIKADGVDLKINGKPLQFEKFFDTALGVPFDPDDAV